MYYGTYVLLALNEQHVRLFVLSLLRLNLKCMLESADYWRSMQHEVVCSLALMYYFAVQINNTLQLR